MLFNSLSYAIFLPIIFILYWIIPGKYRWPLLLFSSYYFYMSWNYKYLLLIITITIISYVAAIFIYRFDKVSVSKKGIIKKKVVLSVSIVACILLLAFFKYFNFLCNVLKDFLSLYRITFQYEILDIVLPVGISFYTFQAISYVIDVYRKKIEPEKNFGIYATFVAFFPQLVAGPIERTENLLPQIKTPRTFNYEQATYGLKLMLWGYFKKLAIADILAEYVDMVYNSPENHQGFSIILTTIFFAIQIYCDFSAYSDIAIGSAKLLGINLMDNFKSPYLSSSIHEFWNRWHISLSSWLKDYIYIPLGGNRVGKLRYAINILITFLISGLWHGANYTFIVWGGLHGVFNVVESLATKSIKSVKINSNIFKIVRVCVTFAFCCFAWIFFRAASISDAMQLITNAFKNFVFSRSFIYQGINDIGLNTFYILQRFPIMFLLPIYDFFSLKTDVIKWISNRNLLVRWGVYILLIWIVLVQSAYSNSSEFIYFQF